MKKIFILISLVLFLTILLPSYNIVFSASYTDIPVSTAHHMIINGSYPDLVVLDVRSNQDDYENGHINGAVWIPHWQLESRISELESHKDHEIIVFSGCGCEGGFSEIASNLLVNYNFSKVYNVPGGIIAWWSKGYPVIVEDLEYRIPIDTNSVILDFVFNPTSREINLTIDGPTGTTGAINITLLRDYISEGYDIQVYLDGEQYPFTLTENATHYFVYISFVHSEHHVLIKFVDMTPPVLSIISPETGSSIKSSSVTVSWSGSDTGSGISHYEVKLGQESWINVDQDNSFSFINLNVGEHTVYVQSVDNSGNYIEESVNFVTINPSLIGGPEWTDDILVFGGISAIIVIIVILLKKRK